MAKKRKIEFSCMQDIVDSLTKRERNELAMAIFIQTDNELYELERTQKKEARNEQKNRERKHTRNHETKTLREDGLDSGGDRVPGYEQDKKL